MDIALLDAVGRVVQLGHHLAAEVKVEPDWRKVSECSPVASGTTADQVLPTERSRGSASAEG
jgi:hypothetical protein